VRRTQIYLTDEQRSRVAERAHERGCAQSQIIRELLDRGLGIAAEPDDPVAAIRETAGLLADEADWETWQASVLGRSADQRLTALNR
jgi:hypothetical protein